MMGSTTSIDYVDATWNPVTGCTPVSPGCDHCYAAGLARRKFGIWKDRSFSDVRCHEDRLQEPYAWPKRVRRVLVPSMGDLFHKEVSNEFRGRIFNVMNDCSDVTFLVLTKRAHNLHRINMWPRNVWAGVSIEDPFFLWRLTTLLGVNAYRWISIEPMMSWHIMASWDVTMFRMLKWVVAGAETGPGARTCHPDCFCSLRDQCIEAGVPFWLKQVDANRDQELNGRTWKQIPEELKS